MTTDHATPAARDSAAARLFDALGAAYEDAYAGLPGQLASLDWLVARLPENARVMDVGSGTGRPTAARLAAAGHRVVGYDVSATMVELARARVPGAVFEVADVRELPDTPGRWEAVTAFFPLLQMPRADIERTLGRFADWLAPGGLLVLAAVPFDGEDVEVTWLDHRVRCTSFPAELYPELLEAAGLDVVRVRAGAFRPDHPGAAEEEYLFLHAVKPGGGCRSVSAELGAGRPPR